MMFMTKKGPTEIIQPTVGGQARWAWEGFSGWNATLGGEVPRALVDQRAVIGATMKMVEVAMGLGFLAGAQLPEPPFRAPPAFDGLCGAAQVAMAGAPNLCKLAQIDVAGFADRREARAALTQFAHGAARGRADAHAALRLNEGLGVELVTRTLEWLHGECFPLVGPADYGRIGQLLDHFSPFLAGVNKEVAAPEVRRASRDRKRAELAEKQREVDERLQVAQVENKLHRGMEVDDEELVAAAEAMKRQDQRKAGKAPQTEKPERKPKTKPERKPRRRRG